MWMNLIKKFKVGGEWGRMWLAARSYTKHTHSYYLGNVMAVSTDTDFA
jgi:hypothetical protein